MRSIRRIWIEGKWLGWFQILTATYGASALLEPAEGCKQFGSLQPLNLNIVLPLNPLKGSEKCGARMWHLPSRCCEPLQQGPGDTVHCEMIEIYQHSQIILQPQYHGSFDISGCKRCLQAILLDYKQECFVKILNLWDFFASLWLSDRFLSYFTDKIGHFYLATQTFAQLSFQKIHHAPIVYQAQKTKHKVQFFHLS